MLTTLTEWVGAVDDGALSAGARPTSAIIASMPLRAQLRVIVNCLQMPKRERRVDTTKILTSPLQRAAEAARTRRFTWGPWRWNPRTFRLVHQAQDYPVDLTEMVSSSQVFRVISQLGMKLWITPEELGHFVLALDALLGLQANYGGEERVDARTLLERHIPAWDAPPDGEG